ncbi:hypothetical protein TTHERM_000274676 (macronuclear) [Tetrahymena thermophila SB210]|uniref:Uncharacterized protein n=1 Tax=Tetrahymena thermophila (strain SB210) TaxID=312017 RepID=W7X4Y4_TETTS|nr:hypothetical protein TTHERM_000274676 [Tetrahymena thermophila SB210]EWS74405.1 hypothetical protein TTHERM_000274676 [Tetrahymena thermophila SB210]|eukprot:XP_012653082.1 hypothetical protein TTHERM_000274676 [Tetrahymena thermophila SB210]
MQQFSQIVLKSIIIFNLIQLNISKIYLKPIEYQELYERFEYSKQLSYQETEEFEIITQIIYKNNAYINYLIIFAQPLECESNNIEMITYIELGQSKSRICDRNSQFQQNNICVYQIDNQVEQSFSIIIKCLSEKCSVQIYFSVQRENYINIKNIGQLSNSFVQIYHLEKNYFLKKKDATIMIQGKFNKILTYSKDIFGNKDCISYQIYQNQIIVIQYTILCEAQIILIVVQSFPRQQIIFDQVQAITIEKQITQVSPVGVQQYFFVNQEDCILEQVQQKIQPFEIIQLQSKAFVDIKCEKKTQLYLFQLNFQFYQIFFSYYISQIKNYEIVILDKYYSYYHGNTIYCYKFISPGYRVYRFDSQNQIITDQYVQNFIKNGNKQNDFQIQLQEITYQSGTEVCFEDEIYSYSNHKGHIIISPNNENLHYSFNIKFYQIQIDLNQYFASSFKINDYIYIDQNVRKINFFSDDIKQELNFGFKIRGIHVSILLNNI